MKTYIQPGESLTLPAPYDVSSGGGVLVGGLFGFAQHDALAGADVTLERRGVFTHAKTSAQAWTVGAQVYWDDTAKVLTTTATDNTLVGAATAIAANPSDTGEVLVDGAVRA
ncbi:DUF2190 family protein [Pseudooceanicola sp. CBS1P-1]|uniref:DUF2190 family protein n=1 Tax=Pseudooceanicola albus TaxID=2692189 RepID=A0A6L7GCY1_9RHOB|nr:MULTISPECIES: DUF2190 family protein [Pseudooceanicola]MBT9386978.1 DUF2190 family protein [Pseudooceanicola endophyticus]MXN21156.1 DUF2190 family protein [Pseudooceanicola albus]